MKYFLAIDLGTTGCRSMVFDEKLHLCGSMYEEYGLIAPKPDWYEQDPNLWWELSLKTMDGAMAQAKIDRKAVRSISISSQGISIVPTDENFNPLRLSLNWMDRRAKEESEEIIRAFGKQEIFTLTGKYPRPVYSLPKFLWIKKHEPEIWAKTAKMLMPLEFLTAKLTGNACTDPSMASGTLMYNIHAGEWHKPTLERFNIPESMLPEIRPCGSSAGCVLPDVADKLGLSHDCIVAVGAQDQRCAALGAGLADGVITVSLGTAAAICLLWDKCDTVGNTAVGWSPYVYSGMFVTEGVVGTAGAALRWLRDTVYPNENYEIINEEAAKAREAGTEVIFLPYLSGSEYIKYGGKASGTFYGLSLAATRGDLSYAVMEGVAFQVAQILSVMKPEGGFTKLILFGGGAKSALWQQIFADATGLEIVVPEQTEAAGAGAALLAGVGSGDFDLNNLPENAPAASTKPSSLYEQTQMRYRKYLELTETIAKGMSGYESNC